MPFLRLWSQLVSHKPARYYCHSRCLNLAQTSRLAQPSIASAPRRPLHAADEMAEAYDNGLDPIFSRLHCDKHWEAIDRLCGIPEDLSGRAAQGVWH